MRYTFSGHGADQFQHDLRAVSQIVDNYLGPGQGELGMKKLYEAVHLLTLPNEPEVENARSFQQVEDEIFASNEKARDALEGLGLVVLTETEARNVLTRRIDLAG